MEASSSSAKVESDEQRLLPKEAPWLVYPDGQGMKNQVFYNPCEPNNTTCRKCIPELSRKSYWQKSCHQGWLVILCDDNTTTTTTGWCYGDCFLWNPVSLEVIQLPNLHHMLLPQYYHLMDCVLTSPPPSTTTDDKFPSLVFVLFEGLGDNHGNTLLFCHPGDRQWRTQDLPSNVIVRSLVYLSSEGKLFVMCRMNLCIEIQLVPTDHDAQIALSTKPPFPISNNSYVSAPLIAGNFTPSRAEYVESCDGREIFMVNKFYHPRGCDKLVLSINISRLNFSLMAWEKVDSLDDHVLFLGHSTSASCSAAAMGLLRGCLFYTMPNDQSLYTHDVQDNATSIILPCLQLSTPLNWIMMRKLETNKHAIEVSEEKISSNEKENKEQNHYDGRELVEATPSAESKYLSPWLVFFTDNGIVHNFVDPMHNHNKYLTKVVSEFLVGATIRFSKSGWLLMTSGRKKVFFYKPFTRETIQLPDIPGDRPYDFAGITFSSLPTSSDCVVSAISHWPSTHVEVFSIARGTESWTSHFLQHTKLDKDESFYPCMLNNPVYYNGTLYFLDNSGALGVFNEDELSCKLIVKPQETFNGIDQCYLVECGGKLLLVELSHLGKSIQIFELDLSNMVWVKVESLGKHVLFISSTSSFSAVAPNSHMENKIYLPRLRGKQILCYSLDGNYSNAGFYNSKEYSNCSWIEPNWSPSTVDELNWFAKI